MRKNSVLTLVWIVLAAGLFACANSVSTNGNGAALTSIAVTPASPSIAIGTSQQFIATGTYADNSTQVITDSVAWTSSSMNNATISKAGLATAVASGTTSITATVADTATVSGTTLLTIAPPALVSIVISPATITIAPGTTKQFIATGAYTDNSTSDITATVTWSSSDADIATINNAGLVTANLPGTAAIIASAGSISASATIVSSELIPSITKAVVKISTSGPLAAGAQIGGIDVTLNLPDGVIVAASQDSGNPAILVTNTGRVTASGAAAGTNTNILATYVSSSGAEQGQIVIHLVNPNGFFVGEFVTVSCDIIAGHNPVQSDFSLTGFHAVDILGAGIQGLNASVSVIFQ